MATRRKGEIDSKPGQSAVKIFAANERMNQLLIEHLDAEVWNAKAPGSVRTIAAIFTHVHNVRTKWVRLTAPHLKVPRQLSRMQCSQAEASAALAVSAARCEEMLAEAFAGGGRIGSFMRDGWAGLMPAGAEMLCYMIAHEAHHRGQACMIAHQLGCKLPGRVTSAMWNWERMLK